MTDRYDTREPALRDLGDRATFNPEPTPHSHNCRGCLGAAWAHVDPECQAGREYGCPDCRYATTGKSGRA